MHKDRTHARASMAQLPGKYAGAVRQWILSEGVMTQMDAFEPYQFPAQIHRKVRMRRAKEATERADADSPKWSEVAYGYLCNFASQREGQFIGEEVISRSRGTVHEPADKRAWGSIFTRAVRAGVIRRDGWSTATRNSSAKPVYVRGPAA